MGFRLLVVLLVTGGTPGLTAQSTQPAFDAVSIRRNVAKSFPIGPEGRRGGSFVATNATLERLVRFAYDLPEYRLAGGPDWVRIDRFDVEARAGRDLPAAELRQLVQAVLEDRFQLVMRQERRETAIYTLRPTQDDARLGPSMRRAAASCAAPGGPGATMDESRTPNGGVATRRTCAPMTTLVSSLSNALRAPVEDGTALEGLWDFELSFTGEQRGNASGAAVARDPNDAPALFTAVQEQLGLRLEAGRGSIDVFVIESAAPPTEN